MLYISTLADEEKQTLEAGHQHGKKAYFRNRCQCILLSASGFEVKELALIYHTRTRTVYDWLHRYQQDGFLGLKIKAGRGLKAPFQDLTPEQVVDIQEQVKENPQSLREVAALLSTKFGFTIAKSALTRYVKKKLKYTWHRLRNWLKPKQNEMEYARLAAELEELLTLEDQPYLPVYFGDESGFCLTPCVPYGWQPCGQYTAMVPQTSPRRNVFGLFSRANAFEGYDTFGTMTGDLLVACLDDFATKITQKTVVVLDNARFHHAAVVQAKIEEWEAQDLYSWYLPAYSPHLNAIETLWRKIKYEWLKPSHYASWPVLNEALDEIVTNIGTKYKIKFT